MPGSLLEVERIEYIESRCTLRRSLYSVQSMTCTDSRYRTVCDLVERGSYTKTVGTYCREA